MNVVADHDVKHTDYMSWMLDAIGVTGVRFVSGPTERRNRSERSYDRTVGAVFGPYVARPSPGFDRRSRIALDEELGLHCPRLDREAFRILGEYAVAHGFGMSDVRRKTPQRSADTESAWTPAGRITWTPAVPDLAG